MESAAKRGWQAIGDRVPNNLPHYGAPTADCRQADIAHVRTLGTAWRLTETLCHCMLVVAQGNRNPEPWDRLSTISRRVKAPLQYSGHDAVVSARLPMPHGVSRRSCQRSCQLEWTVAVGLELVRLATTKRRHPTQPRPSSNQAGGVNPAGEPGHSINRCQHEKDRQGCFPNRDLAHRESCRHKGGHQWRDEGKDSHPGSVR